MPSGAHRKGEIGKGAVTFRLVGAELFAALMVALIAEWARSDRLSAPVPGCAAEAGSSRNERRRRARAVAQLHPCPVAELRPAKLSAVVGKIIADPSPESGSGVSTLSVWAPVRAGGHVHIADAAGDVVRVDLRGQVTGAFRIGDEVFAAGALVGGPAGHGQPRSPPFRAQQPTHEIAVLGPGPGDEFVLVCGTQLDAVTALSPRLFPDALWILRALAVVLVAAAVVTGCIGVLESAG